MSNEPHRTSLPHRTAAAAAGRAEDAAAGFEADLDDRLHYGGPALALAGGRLAVDPGASTAGPSWELAPGMAAAATAHTGAGQLELRQAGRLLARWHYTIGRHAEAATFARAVNDQVARLGAGGAPAAPVAATEPVAEEPAGITSRTTFQSLARLARFARPWARYFIAGFLVSVACTAAGLIPPYITMPLIDKVLIPYQQGAAVDQDKVVWLLSALGAAAVLAWGLGWTRTFVIA
ncbi:MAG: hypothetical protein MUF04_01980, partial [Akkermansiaceae bacterium]|nr:hypothetical protein [Akkermansiaceae bacterium]